MYTIYSLQKIILTHRSYHGEVSNTAGMVVTLVKQEWNHTSIQNRYVQINRTIFGLGSLSLSYDS